MIIYFSGTGNSRFVAEFMAEKLSEEIVDSLELIKAGKTPEYFSEKPWVFVAPTYGWRIPKVFEEFIRSLKLEGSKDAFFVLTCGSDTGGAGRLLSLLCQDLDLHYRGLLEVVMPENYLALFSVPSVEKSRKIVKKALPVIENGISLIRLDRDFPIIKDSKADALKSGFANRFFYNKLVKDKKFHTTDKCISCGKCVELCPLNNITMEVQAEGLDKDGNANIDGHKGSGSKMRPKWNGNCTHCMRCICYCSEEAIEYGKGTKKKRRYRFESNE